MAVAQCRLALSLGAFGRRNQSRNRKLRRAGGESRAVDLDGWLDSILTIYGERTLSLDADVAKIAGVLTEEA